MSMAEWPAGHNLRHLRALHLVSQPHPGSRHGEPKRLVVVGLRSARHGETLLNEMFVNCNLHCTAPSCCICRRYEPWSAAEVRSRNGGKRAVYRESTLRSGTKGLRMLVGKTDHRPSKRVSISNDGGRTARSRVFRQAALTGSNLSTCLS